MSQGDAEGKAKRRARWWLLLPGVPLLLWLLAMAAVGGPWTSSWLAHQLSERLSAQVRIGSVGISTRDGILIKSLTVTPHGLEKPILRLQVVRLSPSWRALLRRKLDIQSLTLDRPEIEVTPGMLAACLPRPQPGAMPTEPPSLSDVQAKATVDEAAQPEEQVVARQAPAAADGQGTSTGPDPAAAAPAAPAKPAPVALPPTRWLHVRHASVVLREDGGDRVLACVRDFTGDIPVLGQATDFHVSLGRLEAMGETFAEGLRVPMQWNGSVLSCMLRDVDLGAVRGSLGLRLVPAKALPTIIEVQVPDQELGRTAQVKGVTLQAKRVKAAGQFRGALSMPGTWLGEWLCEGEGLHFTSGMRDVDFQTGGLMALLRGGVLSVPTLRLWSEPHALLANGALLSDGRLAANARWISSPGVAQAVMREWLPGMVGKVELTRMATPQREALDIETAGYLTGPIYLRVGETGQACEIFKPTSP